MSDEETYPILRAMADGLADGSLSHRGNRQDLAALLAERDRLAAENAQLREGVDWALGLHPTDEFTPREIGDPPFWWRAGLRDRAFRAVSPQEER